MISILGVLKPRTVSGKQLRNGGSALIVSGEDGLHLSALSEERVVREKGAPGFERSMRSLLADSNLNLRDLDVVGISSCCEPLARVLQSGLDPLVGRREVVAVGHHHSHASLSFLGSGYSDALVVIADGGGDVLQADADSDWWRHSREQLSVFSGSRNGLELVSRDFDEPYAFGFGEFFRAVTHFLGWPSSRHAARVMALAAYSPVPDWPDLFAEEDGKLVSPIVNDPNAPIDMVLRIGQELGVNLGEPRKPHSEILRIHRQLAAYTQNQLSKFLALRVSRSIASTGHDHVCLGGGVALNVVANAHVRASTGLEVYVPSAPGDEGQALGNALSILWEREPAALHGFGLQRSSNAFLGPKHKIDSAAVASTLIKRNCSDHAVFEYTSSADVVASLLDASSAVAVFQGRSEYGPRALGNRSILGDPRVPWGQAQFNQIKRRNWFMPFAPTAQSMDPELTSLGDFFDLSGASPFMSFADRVHESQVANLPAVVANDGTARLQTLASDDETFAGEVLRSFAARTGVPVLLNTSFNDRDEPIVETLDDAVGSFGSLPVNILSAGRFLIVKSLSPELIKAGVMPATFPVKVYAVKDGTRRDLGVEGVTANEAIRQVQSAVGQVVFVRSELPLYGPYLEKLRQGKKVTTIRFRANAVELPAFSEIPLFETSDYGVGDRSRPTAIVRIKSLRYQVWGTLNAEDAARDGFDSYDAMRTDLLTIYPRMKDSDWVTIYEIVLAQENS